ncbi:MAG: hypothetical protein CMH57_02750 [Myxococcales bacterium]|nr:hypothetical protein [Myxococcales bacterium]
MTTPRRPERRTPQTPQTRRRRQPPAQAPSELSLPDGRLWTPRTREENLRALAERTGTGGVRPALLPKALPSSRADEEAEFAEGEGFEVQVDVAKGIIRGYANTWTWDAYWTKFIQGAFKKSIDVRHTDLLAAGKPSRINFRLEHRDAVGRAVHLEEDSTGLLAEAQVVDFKNQAGLGYRALMLAAEQVVTGLSIGFDWVWDQVKFLTTDQMIEEGLDPHEAWWWDPAYVFEAVLREWSLVSDPANEESRVEVVRSIEKLLVPGWRPSGDAEPRTPTTTTPRETTSRKERSMPRRGKNSNNNGARRRPFGVVRRTGTRRRFALRGANVGAMLDEAIGAMVTDDLTREEIIADLAEAAGTEEGTVSDIVAGVINCPGRDRLEALGEALGLSIDDLLAAAEDDGCTYAEDEDDDSGDGDEMSDGGADAERDGGCACGGCACGGGLSAPSGSQRTLRLSLTIDGQLDDEQIAERVRAALSGATPEPGATPASPTPEPEPGRDERGADSGSVFRQVAEALKRPSPKA